MRKIVIKQQGKLFQETAYIDLKSYRVEMNGACKCIQQLRLDSPVSGRIYGLLLNYQGALAALGPAVNEAPYKEPPKAPILYIKPVNTINGFGKLIPVPEEEGGLEMGAALGVVIGKKAVKVEAESALHYVSGYTIVNDVSIPHSNYHRPAVKQKARDGFCPIGPWIMDRDEISDPNHLGIRVFINGELRQESNTANLIRSVARSIADITEFMTLDEGDLLLMGVPERAPLAKVGDTVRLEIDEIGYLENTLVSESDYMSGGAI